MRVVTLRGRVSFWGYFVRGSVVIIFFFEGCSEDIMYLFAFDFSLHIFLLSISYMGLLERENKYPMIFDISILLCRSIPMSYMIGEKQW